MSARDRIVRWLSFGRTASLDPNEVVEVGMLPNHLVPMAQALLADRGIALQTSPEVSVVHKTSTHTFVRVRRADFDEATRIVSTLT